VASAAGSVEEAEGRRRAHPDALLEEMEGYAVAVAATLWQIPLSIVRGVSNAAGDRDKAHWRMPEALAAAGDRVASMLN
jgi:futalosine hydrolase